MNLYTGSLNAANGNVSASYFIGNGSLLTGISGGSGNTGNITFSNTTISSNVANANVTVQGNGTGNINLASSVSVTGNITVDYIYGNGYYLTGLPTATIENQTLVGNSVQTTFTLDYSTTATEVLVTINGVSQTPNVDYTVAGTVMTFTTAPATGDTVQVRFFIATIVGNGTANTGNITFNNTTISSNVANANVTLQGNGTGAIVIQNTSNSSLIVNSTASNVQNLIRVATTGTTLGIYGGGAFEGSYILGNGSPTQANNRLATFIGSGSENGTTLTSPAPVRITMDAAANWSSGNTPTHISFWTTATGTNVASETARFESGGNLNIYTGNINAANGNVSANFFVGNGSALTGITASANTGNVTFNDINIIGTGNLHLQPDPGNVSAYLDIYLTAGPDIHIAGNGETVILGTDEFANVTVNVDGNVSIQANAATPYTWTFDTAGNLILPAVNDNQQQVQGTQQTILGDPFPTSAVGNVSVTVWTADSAAVSAAKMTMRAQYGNTGTPILNIEIMDIMMAKTYPNGIPVFTVSNRVKTNPAYADTLVDVTLAVGNVMQVTSSGPDAVGIVYWTYSVTAFNQT